MNTNERLIIITAYLDALCEEDDIVTVEEFAQYFRGQTGFFPSLLEIDYFKYYAQMFGCLRVVFLDFDRRG